MKTFIKVIILIIILFSLFYAWQKDDNEIDSEQAYLRGLHLKLSFRVERVKSTNYHGYGTLYVSLIKYNGKPDSEYAYKGKYIFCTIKGNNAIVVLGGTSTIISGDIVTVDTKTLKYDVYRKGKLYVSNGVSMNNDDSFYNYLNAQGYLSFIYYKK